MQQLASWGRYCNDTERATIHNAWHKAQRGVNFELVPWTNESIALSRGKRLALMIQGAALGGL